MPQPAEPAPRIDDALIGERPAGRLHRREQRAGGDGGRALDVVVEGAEPVAVALEQAAGVGAGEVLPLEQDVRPARMTAVTNASTKSSYSWPRMRSCRQPM